MFKDDELLKSAIIGSSGAGIGVNDSSVIVDNDKILICCGASVFCLLISDLSLLWQTKADDVACFEIFKYRDTYIVHGELNISRLDKNGKIIWHQSGHDIFTSPDGEFSFQLTDDFIITKDWGGKIYKFDYDGNYSWGISQLY